MKLIKSPLFMAILLVLCCLLTAGYKAQQIPPLLKLPVQHEGRIKPLYSFFEHYLKQWGAGQVGKSIRPDIAADNLLWDQSYALELKMFKIDKEHTIQALGLEDRKSRFYSYAEMVAGLDTTIEQAQKLSQTEDLTADETDLLRVHENALEMLGIARSFSGLVPLNLESGKSGKTYLDYMQQKQKPAKKLADDLMLLQNMGKTSTPLKIIPTSHEKNAPWLSPWDYINGGATPAAKPYFESVRKLANAPDYQNLKTLKALYPPAPQLQAELFYKSLKAWGLSAVFLTLALAFSLQKRWPLLHKAADSFYYAALMLQIINLGLRIYILERAPVSNLPESMLFVSVLVLAGFAGLRAKVVQWQGMAGAIAIGIYFMAGVFAKNGDDLEVVMAVLNTQFWLSTHVLCVTAGYAVCLIAAGLAHIALYKKAAPNYLPTLHTINLTALLLMAVGTALGGIWADQSWGRFWGWDPKENGALLITLYLAWLIHGKIAGLLKPAAYSLLSALVVVPVALSWVGVNLLGVGLHAYGFAQSDFYGLTAFFVLQIAVLLWLWDKNRA